MRKLSCKRSFDSKLAEEFLKRLCPLAGISALAIEIN